MKHAMQDLVSRRRLGTLGVGAAATAVGGTALGAGPAAAIEFPIKPSAWDYLKGLWSLGQAIWGAIEKAQGAANREGGVQSLLNAAWYEAGESKNVLVIKDDHPYSISGIEGLEVESVYHFDGMPSFRVFVFDNAVVTNNGDGGYINWAFRGWFDRQDMTVTFHRP